MFGDMSRNAVTDCFHLSSAVQLRHERQAEEPGVEHHHVDVSVHRAGRARVSVLCGVVRSDPVPSQRGKDHSHFRSLSVHMSLSDRDD